MIIAIDFDGTWTRDPIMFGVIVQMAKDRLHTCVLVTGRSDEGQWGNEVRREIGDLMPIVFAANGGKRKALIEWLRANGRSELEHVVWIDDNPLAIGPVPGSGG